MFISLIQTLEQCKNYRFQTLYGIGNGVKDIEFIGLVFADHPHLGYYYAHIAKHPDKDCWVSCLVNTSRFIFGNTGEEWVKNFNYWLRVRLDYEPVSYQIATYTYVECSDIETAAFEMQKMLSNFDHYAARYTDLNFGNRNISDLICFYGMEDFRDENGVYPEPPECNDITVH